MPKRLTAITEVSEVPGYESFSLRFLRNLIYGNRLANYKVGGRVLIDLDDLDDLVASGRRDPIAT